MQPAVAMDEALLAAFDRLLDHLAGPIPVMIILDQRMRRWLADEDEMPAGVRAPPRQSGLAREQIVAEIDGLEVAA